MRTKKLRIIPLMTASLLATSIAQANIQNAVPYPDPAPMDQRKEVQLIGYNDFQAFEKLKQYQEPEYITKLVKEGKLPPVEERLPKEPYVFKSSAMEDGPGEYGGVLRMVTGGRPQGWNWMAGQIQGNGGVNYTVQECLTRTGPMFQLKTDELEPLPNLAKSWEWSKDGKKLTMHLIEGAKWSDGQPFTADDVMFMWEDNVLDANVPSPLNKDSLGKGVNLKKVDDYTIEWESPTVFPKQNLFSMSALKFCPGPSHVLKPRHPKYNPDATYDSYINALGPDLLPWVTMGAWTAVEYKPDQMIVMRRNPYYWKVDEKGNQLPYLNEVQFKLSTWSDRTTQTLAGAADLSNMENPPIYVESLKKANSKKSPVRLDFGPRTVGFEIQLNFAESYGAQTERDKAIRQLNRDSRFRRALSHALDRPAIGQSLARGPFTHVYAGGILPETSYFNKESVVYYPHSVKSAKELLAEVGLKDLNNDGYLQWTDGSMKGRRVDLTINYTSTRPSDATLAENIIAMFKDVGLSVISRPLNDNAFDNSIRSANYDMVIYRSERENITPDTQLSYLAPTTNRSVRWHRSDSKDNMNLLDFEKELVGLVEELRVTTDPAKKAKLMDQYLHTYTENNYSIGLTAAPGALILNKRLKNATAGTPILAYQWAEDSLVRERLWGNYSAPSKECLS